MSELISGKEAKLAWANGKTIEFHYADTIWAELPSCAQLSIFDDEEIKFRLKPRTITLNGIELPKPLTAVFNTTHKTSVELDFETEQDAINFSKMFSSNFIEYI